MRVKICGLTRLLDAQAALDLGATELGFIFAQSPRQVSVDAATKMVKELKGDKRIFGVFVNETLELILSTINKVGLNGVQLHGQESIDLIYALKRIKPDLLVIKTIPVTENKMTLNPEIYKSCDALLFDCGGSHLYPAERGVINTEIISPIPFFLAGGLNPENINERISKYSCMGVDLSSGVESSPGIKDLSLLQKLFSSLKDIL